jgi:uncharacterized protein (TIGR02246 family)
MDGALLDPLDAIMRRLEHAWASGDGFAFAEEFATNACFVNILGDMIVGRQEIARHHDEIFSTIYRGSTVVVNDLRTMPIRDDVASFRVSAVVHFDGGELPTDAAGVAAVESGAWVLHLFHNMVPFAPPRP